MGGNIISTILLLLSTIIIIIFAYYTTIIIGKNTNGFLKKPYIKVLDKSNIGLNTSLIVLKINKKIYILAQQAKTIELIDIINEEDWNYLNYEGEDDLTIKDKYESFRIDNMFEKIKKYKNKRYGQNGSEKNE